MDKRKSVNAITDILFSLLGRNDKNRNYLMKSVCMSCEKESDWYIQYRARRKRASRVKILRDFAELSEKCSIIIQGAIKEENDFTIETVKQYRKYYPDLPIIISTWNNTSNNVVDDLKLAGAEVVLSKKPELTGLGNVNFQRISTLAGCKRARELGCGFALKTRTDQRIYKPFFLEYFMTLIDQYPTYNAIDDRRLIVGPGIVGKTMFLPFMLSDFIYFGKVGDIEIVFSDKQSNVNMTYEERAQWTNRLRETMCQKDFLAATAPELQLIRHYCNTIGNIETELTVKSYWQCIKDYLICLGWNDIDLYWPKYGLYNESKIENTLDKEEKIDSYTWDFGKWLMLYQGKIKYREEYEQFSNEIG